MTIALVKVSCINDRLIPLGLACLQAFLKQNSMLVKIFNFRTANYTLPKVVFDPLIQLNLTNFIVNHQDLPLLIPIANDILNNREPILSDGVYPDILEDYSSRMFESPETTKTRFENIVEYNKNTVLVALKEFDIIGFSLNYLNISETVIASCYLKLHNPDCKIIWGGPTITQSFEAFKLFLYKGVCDGLVIGEGEKPILDIALGNDLKGIKGVMSINEKKIVQFTKGDQIDLDLLPIPDYTDIPLDTYYQIASIYRSRGCTNRCNFCAEWNLFGPRFRTRSIEIIVRDVEEIVEKYKPGFILFGESLINDDLDYFEQLCDALIERNLGIKFGTHFRANITPELAKKAKLAGFEDAWVGFEAFSEEDLKKMNKGTSVVKNMETIENLTQAGVNVIAMLVVGFSDLRGEHSLSFWSTACARGEEPYSIAILLAEFLGHRLRDFNISIRATDISRHALHEAQAGLYSLKEIESLPPAIIANYFTRSGEGYAVRADIRRMVNFSYFDLVSNKTPSFMNLDCIFCCNILIYLQKQLQERVLGMLYNSLATHGYLVLGEVETPTDSLRGRSECLDAKANIYKKNDKTV